MKSRKLSTLGAKVREKRGDAKLRETADQIGVSAPTLLRIEAGRIPDVQTFGKICQWLQISPESFLGYSEINKEEDEKAVQVSVHLKAPKLMNEETLGALSRMIILASKSQTASTDLDDDDNA